MVAAYALSRKQEKNYLSTTPVTRLLMLSVPYRDYVRVEFNPVLIQKRARERSMKKIFCNFEVFMFAVSEFFIPQKLSF